MLAAKLLSSLSGAAEEKLYVDDVFSAYTYTGNGGTLSINNGIDLAGRGGLVWQKNRGLAVSHFLVDTVRGYDQGLSTNSANGSTGYGGLLSAFNNNGFTLGTYNNNNLQTYASWTFRKAPKFFDVVTYTGNSVLGRQIPHALGVTPGMVIVKCTNQTGSWTVLHVSLGGTKVLFLDQTSGSFTNSSMWNNTDPTSSVFTVGNSMELNANGYTYVAYLFAHDPSADGLIQCGGFTTDGSGNATVNHSWTKGVQFAIVKASSTAGDWEMYDTTRTSGWAGSDARLCANQPNAEDAVTRISASGTSVSFTELSASATYIYMFIVNP